MYSPDLSHGRVVQKSIKQRFRWSVIAAIAFVSVCPLPATGTLNPAPDGGYPNNNTAEGTGALNSLTSGGYNTAVGTFALTHNATAYDNTAIGSNALQNNTTGADNTATGSIALVQNTTGGGNTASGAGALNNNTSGDYNTGNGLSALSGNIGGSFNTATGSFALRNNKASSNTATGYQALYRNDSGSYNTANGFNALYTNSSASYNTAQGYDALFSNTTGTFNTADGVNALLSNQGGNNNSAVGFNALASNISGSNNIGIGYQAGYNLSTGSNNIIIGAGVLGKAGEANTTRIGKTTQTAAYIGGIYNKTAASGSAAAVFIDSTGKLGTVKSSARYKDNIKPMDKASEALLALEPVTFRFKEEIDPDGVTQFGLIAEQVEKVEPRLVIRDENGKVNTVRYEAVNAMLLNEFLKNYRTDQDQGRKLHDRN
jgi:hypothetical protein